MRLPNFSTPAKIGIGWALSVAGGLYAFYLSKEHIQRNRYESMKVRERLRKVTQEDYTPSRNYGLTKIAEKDKTRGD